MCASKRVSMDDGQRGKHSIKSSWANLLMLPCSAHRFSYSDNPNRSTIESLPGYTSAPLFVSSLNKKC